MGASVRRSVRACGGDNPPVRIPDYRPDLAALPLTDDELDALDDQLAGLPSDAALNIEALDGFLAALAAGPGGATRLPAARWIESVWGGGQPFASEKQKKRLVTAVLRHLHAVDTALAGPPDAWEPIFSIAEDGDREWVDAEDWCAGFLQAVALDPAAWTPAFEDAALAPALRPLVTLGADPATLSGDERAALQSDAQRDALSRAVVDAVVAVRAWHQARA